MKNNYICLTMLMLLGWSLQAQAQQVPLGKCAALMQQVKGQAGNAAGRSAYRLDLTTPTGTLTGKINARTSGAESEYVIGEIENVAHSSFYLRIEGNTLQGNIVLRDSKKAYRYYADENGMAYVTEEDINKVICIDYETSNERTSGSSRSAATAEQIGAAVANLESFPGANGCVLLDFDGQNVSGTPWNNGNLISAAPATLNDAQIQEVWELVSEDYKPFHINITTNEAVFNTYPRNRRMRCIFTPTNTAAPGAGGVAYIGSFNWNDETPCWVFNGGVKGAGDAASHEVGHTFGLGHDGRTNPVEDYYQGQGNWAPIMGVGYYKPIVQWSKGEYANANNREDDLAKIASATYGVGYRADDVGGTTASAAGLAAGAVNRSGLIERTGDVDMFSFTTGGGTVSLTFAPAARQANLDILATLYNVSGGVITTSNPSGQNAGISTSLSAGTYYVSVTGSGAGTPATDGYSNYGSIGLYTITGNIPATSTGVATFYENCDYGGYVVSLGEGSYNLGDLQARGIGNDAISSLRVQNGYKVTLYFDINFTGTALVKTADDACLVDDGFNDKATALIIARNTAIAGTQIEAENFSSMAGVQTEACTDTNGGLNAGYIETGDWMAYNNITIASSGNYLIEYRVASESGGGRLSLDINAGATVLGNVDVPSTGGWQSWTTVSHTVNIAAGTYPFGIFAQAGGFNINWWRITPQSGAAAFTQEVATAGQTQAAGITEATTFSLYPNPVSGSALNILSSTDLASGTVRIINQLGVEVISLEQGASAIDVATLPPGVYTLVFTGARSKVAKHFIKQ